LRSPASLEAFELEGKFDMLTSKLMSVAGLIGAAALSAAIAPSCAFAANLDDQVTVTVSTADLNMGSEAGARAALHRIQYAANEICGGDGGERGLGEQMESRSCVQATVKRTVASVNLPTLTAVSQGRHVSVLASTDH
jgi:UrcA family protein